jgi:hypothetical protein
VVGGNGSGRARPAITLRGDRNPTGLDETDGNYLSAMGWPPAGSCPERDFTRLDRMPSS